MAFPARSRPLSRSEPWHSQPVPVLYPVLIHAWRSVPGSPVPSLPIVSSLQSCPLLQLPAGRCWPRPHQGKDSPGSTRLPQGGWAAGFLLLFTNSLVQGFSVMVLWFSSQCCGIERCWEHKVGVCGCSVGAKQMWIYGPFSLRANRYW